MTDRLRNAQARLKAELDRLGVRDLYWRLNDCPKIQIELEATVIEHTELMIQNAELNDRLVRGSNLFS